jgi:PleD family two-component response regulator
MVDDAACQPDAVTAEQQRRLGDILTYELARVANLCTTTPADVLLVDDVQTSARVLIQALRTALARVDQARKDGRRLEQVDDGNN